MAVPHWPEADFIIGNPPFLGSKLFRQQGLDDEYIAAVFAAYDLPNTSDLCCYWFERARQQLERNPRLRVGLLATQGIRGGANRTVLERIKQTGDIFMAWSDRPWILDGAAVHVSIVGFSEGPSQGGALDGKAVDAIHADLTGDLDTGGAALLPQNVDIAFMGTTKGGKFEVPWDQARDLLSQPNPNGRSNAEVVRPWVNGSDLTKRTRAMWIVDFGCDMTRADAALFEAPYRAIELQVQAEREEIRQEREARIWWRHNRPRPAMRRALPSDRFVATPNLTKHRLFAVVDGRVLPDHQLIAFARSDDYFFGVLHSAIHELWALRQGTQLEDRPRYTPTTCFETFPLPWAPGSEPVAQPPSAEANGGGGPEGTRRGAVVQPQPRATVPHSQPGATVPHSQPRAAVLQRQPGADVPHSQPGADVLQRQPGAAVVHQRIGDAAAALNEQRERWLNPPEWIEPIAAAVDAEDDFADVPDEARGLIRQSAIMARAAKDPRLKRRTLTNLYNERPTWLKLAHEALDRAVLAAYALVDPEGTWSEDWAEVWVDTGAGQPLPDDHPLTERRGEVDQQVLANLLRLNLARAGQG